MKHRRAPFTLAAVLLAACALGGCRAVNRTITDKAYEAYNQNGTRFGWIGGRTYKLDDASLAEIPFEGVAEFENVRVSYPHGLADQALHIAEHVAHISQTASEAIALNFTHDPHAYLLRVDNLPGAVDISLKVDPNTMPLPLFVQAGRDDWRTILAESTIFPYAIVHELTEASLVMPRAGNPVAPDLGVQYLLPVQLAVKNYTRWFRDGLANYAGYVAYQTSAAQIDYTAETSPLHRHPFSSLARVGDDLFTWHQYSDAEKNDDYYNAAFGLFLLIEHRNGIDAIRGMVAGKDALEFADGKAMIALADEVLNADIRKLAADFRFPQTGLELAQVTPAVTLNLGLTVNKGMLVTAIEPNSIADVAGIQKGDVITHVADLPIQHHLDFELALFENLAQAPVSVTVERGRQTLTRMLPLEPAAEPPKRKQTAH
ncbi:MAG TPA: PDZ domain-containing protein [Anaerohalosphaeraceae bacterium]|nr:PDZ domain-containing protein [Anaerohalosphaeraceae bacterium]HRT49036.1 PDZ domain-containing protein [Anaerohalosphaeraceae bacterium]HRT88186.1 PDZ domain-containing protein [Anaerohalosphaeraceae bacterium]